MKFVDIFKVESFDFKLTEEANTQLRFKAEFDK